MSDYLQLVQTYFPYVAKGASITIQLTIVALLGSVALGLLTTFAKLANLRLLRIVASIYIELIRATPALLQLFIIYFGLTSFGLRLDPFTAASITLSLVGGAYVHPAGDAPHHPAAGGGDRSAALHQLRHFHDQGHVAGADHFGSGDHVPVLRCVQPVVPQHGHLFDGGRSLSGDLPSPVRVCEGS
jgi:His/Glu/Gln/Arg/opine family amino acid ABC transporter permease subunit